MMIELFSGESARNFDEACMRAQDRYDVWRLSDELPSGAKIIDVTTSTNMVYTPSGEPNIAGDVWHTVVLAVRWESAQPAADDSITLLISLAQRLDKMLSVAGSGPPLRRRDMLAAELAEAVLSYAEGSSTQRPYWSQPDDDDAGSGLYDRAGD